MGDLYGPDDGLTSLILVAGMPAIEPVAARNTEREPDHMDGLALVFSSVAVDLRGSPVGEASA